MKKPTGTMTVTLPETGQQLEVPKGLSGDKLRVYVQSKLQEQEAAAALEQAKQQEEVSKLQSTQIELTQLQALMEKQSRVIEELRAEKKQLEMATPEASAATMALIHASQQAQTLRSELLKDLGAASDWRARFNDDISQVAAEVRKKNAVADSELEKRRRANRILFDDIRANQGMERQHPELLEKVVITPEVNDD